MFPLEILCNLFDNPLEGNFADEEVGGLLQAPDLAEGNSAGSVAEGLFFAISLLLPFLSVRFPVGALACVARGRLLAFCFLVLSARSVEIQHGVNEPPRRIARTNSRHW